MANENETVMAVCAEWRECIEAADPTIWDDARIAGLVKTYKAQQIAYLDRVEAAWKRDVAEAEADSLAVGGVVEAARQKPIGNAAAMREALESVRNWCLNRLVNASYQVTVEGLLSVVNAALSEPARNCDVGTAEEQEERLVEFCNSTDCGRCPHNRVGMDFRGCTLTWAQSHYEADKKGDGDGM